MLGFSNKYIAWFKRPKKSSPPDTALPPTTKPATVYDGTFLQATSAEKPELEPAAEASATALSPVPESPKDPTVHTDSGPPTEQKISYQLDYSGYPLPPDRFIPPPAMADNQAERPRINIAKLHEGLSMVVNICNIEFLVKIVKILPGTLTYAQPGEVWLIDDGNPLPPPIDTHKTLFMGPTCYLVRVETRLPLYYPPAPLEFTIEPAETMYNAPSYKIPAIGSGSNGHSMASSLSPTVAAMVDRMKRAEPPKPTPENSVPLLPSHKPRVPPSPLKNESPAFVQTEAAEATKHTPFSPFDIKDEIVPRSNNQQLAAPVTGPIGSGRMLPRHLQTPAGGIIRPIDIGIKPGVVGSKRSPNAQPYPVDPSPAGGSTLGVPGLARYDLVDYTPASNILPTPVTGAIAGRRLLPNVQVNQSPVVETDSAGWFPTKPADDDGGTPWKGKAREISPVTDTVIHSSPLSIVIQDLAPEPVPDNPRALPKREGSALFNTNPV